MLKIILIIFPVIVFLFQDIDAQNLTANHTDVGLGLTIEIHVDIATDMVDIEMTGPADSWWAFGFGGNVMDGTYAIITEATNGGEIQERKLGDHFSGTALTSSLTSMNISDNGTDRTVSIQLPRENLDTDYYTFPAVESIESFIYAKGQDPSLQFHGSTNYGQGTAGNNFTGLSFSTILPVRWSNFNIENKDRNVHLKWETDAEENNKGFTIQRSKNSIVWDDLYFKNAKRKSGSVYSYIDKTALPGINYYRLKQIDNNGKIVYSVIKSIEFGSNAPFEDIKFYPNPVKDIITIEIGENEVDKRLQIFDSNLKLIRDVLWTSEAMIGFNLSSYPSGYYILRIKTSKWTFNKYFIKH